MTRWGRAGPPPGRVRLRMWWNFVARTPEEMADAVAGWREGRFGTVAGCDCEPLQAPPLDALRLHRNT